MKEREGEMTEKKQVPLEPYYAYDRRCYDGAPCSDLQREWDQTEALEKRMKKANPLAFVTYFPVEGKWEAATSEKYQSITGRAFYCKQMALIDAIEFLEKKRAEMTEEQKREEEAPLFQ